jgi:Domain of unknown function (DUF4261)
MDVEERIIAMVALKESTRIDAAAVVERVKAMFPWLAKSVGTPPEQPDGNDTFLIPIGDMMVAVLPIHFPVPKETLARALAMNWAWPEAAQAFEAHRAHVIVSALSPTNDPRYFRTNANRVTCVTAALAELLPATGVYWSTAEHVIAPEQFIAEAKEHTENGTPFDLWVTTEFFPGPKFDETKEIIVRTCGMQIFIGREVECGPYAKEPDEIVPLVRMVGWYVLDRNVQFQGGESIGTSADPVATIQIGRSALPDLRPVYRVVPAEASPDRAGEA